MFRTKGGADKGRVERVSHEGGGGRRAGGDEGEGRMQAEEAAARPKAAQPKPQAGVGIVFKEVQQGGKQCLVVKALAPGAPAISSGLIDVGDTLVSVDGKKINTTETATKAILGSAALPPRCSPRKCSPMSSLRATAWAAASVRVWPVPSVLRLQAPD